CFILLCNSFVTSIIYSVMKALTIKGEVIKVKGKVSFIIVMMLTLVVVTACSNSDEGGNAGDDVVKVGVLASLTGALEAYGKQTQEGFDLGLEYATDGTMEVAGKEIEVIYEDTETKPEVAVQKATKLLEEDKVDFLVGSSDSGDTLAVVPLAEEYEKI